MTGDLQLFRHVQVSPGRLFAVAQCGVKNTNSVTHNKTPSFIWLKNEGPELTVRIPVFRLVSRFSTSLNAQKRRFKEKGIRVRAKSEEEKIQFKTDDISLVRSSCLLCHTGLPLS
jgi:hypothetical protein